jgi:hypothetical protein
MTTPLEKCPVCNVDMQEVKETLQVMEMALSTLYKEYLRLGGKPYEVIPE